MISTVNQEVEGRKCEEDVLYRLGVWAVLDEAKKVAKSGDVQAVTDLINPIIEIVSEEVSEVTLENIQPDLVEIEEILGERSSFRKVSVQV